MDFKALAQAINRARLATDSDPDQERMTDFCLDEVAEFQADVLAGEPGFDKDSFLYEAGSRGV